MVLKKPGSSRHSPTAVRLQPGTSQPVASALPTPYKYEENSGKFCPPEEDLMASQTHHYVFMDDFSEYWIVRMVLNWWLCGFGEFGQSGWNPCTSVYVLDMGICCRFYFFFLFPLPLETLSFLCHLLPTGSAFSAVALCFLLSLPVPQVSTLYVLDTSILTHCLYLSLI